MHSMNAVREHNVSVHTYVCATDVMCIWVHVRLYVCTHVRMCVRVCVCVHLYFACAWLFICMQVLAMPVLDDGFLPPSLTCNANTQCLGSLTMSMLSKLIRQLSH